MDARVALEAKGEHGSAQAELGGQEFAMHGDEDEQGASAQGEADELTSMFEAAWSVAAPPYYFDIGDSQDAQGTSSESGYADVPKVARTIYRRKPCDPT